MDEEGSLVVAKFGGTCLADDESRRRTVEHCVEMVGEGGRLVAVVSAMGRLGAPYATDTLLGLVSSPTEAERSCLLACGEIVSAVVLSGLLRDAGVDAVALSGWDAGLRTVGDRCDADLSSVDRTALSGLLREHRCVVVAGFQGANESGEVTTLGRGGSDVTAVGIACALGVGSVRLYKTVESLYTADPEVVPAAGRLERIAAEDLRQMAWQGAKVVHPRASEIAVEEGVSIEVRAHATGELVSTVEPFQVRSGRYITGVAAGREVTQVEARAGQGAGPAHGFFARVFRMVAEAGVSMDMFSVGRGRAVFTVPVSEEETVVRVLEAGGIEVSTRRPCVKVSIVGAGMHGMRGVMARFAGALDRAGIEMLQTVDSHATISALVPLEERDEALRSLHAEFLGE